MRQIRWLYKRDSLILRQLCQCGLQQLHLADASLLQQKLNQRRPWPSSIRQLFIQHAMPGRAGSGPRHRQFARPPDIQKRHLQERASRIAQYDGGCQHGFSLRVMMTRTWFRCWILLYKNTVYASMMKSSRIATNRARRGNSVLTQSSALRGSCKISQIPSENHHQRSQQA